jgi:hypothetical protein
LSKPARAFALRRRRPKTLVQLSRPRGPSIPSDCSSYKPRPRALAAPRSASRRFVALAAAAEYRPCSAVSRDGVAFVAGQQK